MRARSGRRESWSKRGVGVAICSFVTLSFFLSWWELSYRDTVSRGGRWRPNIQINVVDKDGIVLRGGAGFQGASRHGNLAGRSPRRGVVDEEDVPVSDGGIRETPPDAPYRLIQLPKAVNAAAAACEEQPADCRRFNDFVQSMIQGATSEDRARLYIVPVDPLAMIREVNPNLYAKLLRTLIDELNSSRPYIRFKGSDHVFVCLAAACQSFGEELAEKLADDRGTRAIFAGVDLDVERLTWPCPLRTLNIDRQAVRDLGSLPGKITREAAFMIDRHNRWVCADEFHAANHFGSYESSMDVGGIYMDEYQFTMCLNPKSGSTMMMFLLRRMKHRKDWRSRKNGLPHNPELSGLDYVSSIKRKDPNVVKAIYDSPFILKAVLVRHPIPRLLSAYLDKIEVLKEYNRVEGLEAYVKARGVPSFAEFVEYLITTFPDPDVLEEHFQIQSARCGARYHRFDFVGHLSDVGTEFKEFAQSLKFYDEYVATGWGEDEKQQFGVRSYQVDQRYAGMQIWKYYTDELMTKVYRYYKEDFDRFGFTLDEILVTKPSTRH